MFNQKGSLSVILGIIIFFSLAGGLFYYFTDQSHLQTLAKFIPLFASSSPNPNQPKCQKYGPLSKEEYLNTYLIGSEDTVESIAKSQLKNASRVNEIAILNKLSSTNASLKPGTKLYLPPFYIESSNGYIMAVQGNVNISTVNNILVWSIKESNNKLVGIFPIVDLNDRHLTDGQCVKVIYQGGPIPSEQKILTIIPE